jgi:ABC-type lipoprotein export system ATPase subunit
MNLFPFSWGNQTSTLTTESHSFIELSKVDKSYRTAAGDYPVLKDVDLEFHAGEFISIIGKSGSGKTTLLNMITGIDRPTNGEVWVNGSPLHTMSEGQMARWRGRNLGIVFQFFQLLPTLSILENILLAMDFGGIIPGAERKKRALYLLDLVELAAHAHKLPLALSGGQQQRVAIARALANDPPLLIADEPTGNLDSKTAESVFELFNHLVAQGKTIIIVTHDSALAKRTNRTALIADGIIVNQFAAQALPLLSPDQLSRISQQIKSEHFEAGALIVRQNSIGDDVFIVLSGNVELVLQRPAASDVLVAHLEAGQYFGKMHMPYGKGSSACVRASESTPVDVLKLDQRAMNELLGESQARQAFLLDRPQHNSAQAGG